MKCTKPNCGLEVYGGRRNMDSHMFKEHNEPQHKCGQKSSLLLLGTVDKMCVSKTLARRYVLQYILQYVPRYTSQILTLVTFDIAGVCCRDFGSISGLNGHKCGINEGMHYFSCPDLVQHFPRFLELQISKILFEHIF